MKKERKITENFREMLQQELASRCGKNPSYSLRAFSKTLGIDHSALSKILSGKRPIGPNLIKKLAPKLGLSPEATSDGYHFVENDEFEIISDWHHNAILEMMALDNFKPDVSWIAQYLGISIFEVKAALSRLQRLNLIEITNQGGHWKDLTKGWSSSIGTDLTSSARRKHEKQILERSITALENIPIERRDQSSMIFVVDELKLEQAKKEIKTFRRKLAKLMSKGKKKTRLYHLSVSMFPVK